MDKLNSYIQPDELITLPDDKEMSIAVLQDLIAEHKKLCVTRYETLRKAYIGDYPILHQADKEKYKPDNRVVVNFAKYIVDTMIGFLLVCQSKSTPKMSEWPSTLTYWISTMTRTTTTPNWQGSVAFTAKAMRFTITMRVARLPLCT